jgi:RNA polymerase-binding transcription factor DksA
MAATKPLSPGTIERLERRLRKRREEIADAADSFHEEAEDALANTDMSDLLDDEEPAGGEVDETLMMAMTADEQLAMVDAALDRIAAGTYGYCAECGGRIPVVRLEAIPATPSCVDCAASARRR